jgi:hypothetical protein
VLREELEVDTAARRVGADSVAEQRCIGSDAEGCV